MPTPLVEVLRRRRTEILDDWTRRVLDDPKLPEANRLHLPALHDSIPKLLDHLGAALAAEDAACSAAEHTFGAAEAAREHARDRLDQRYTLDEGLRELSHLRAAIHAAAAREEIAESERCVALIHAAIDDVMRIAAIEMERAARAGEAFERERLRAVLRLLPVGVFLADEAGTLVEANPAAERFWGVSVMPRVRPTEYGLFKAWCAHTGEPVTAESWGLSRAMREGEAVGEQELDIAAFDGVHRTVVNSAAPIRDSAGRVIGGVAVNVDITERKRVERELRREAELRERTVGILGHDLRSPLAAVTFGASALLRRKDVPEAARKTIQRIARGAGRMARMINDLLDLTRVRNSGGLPVQPRPIDLLGLGRQVAHEIEAQHPGRALHFQHRGDLRGSWDPDRLTQVLSNLASNAVQHSAGDAPVRLSMWGEGDEVILEVHNEGRPIPAAMRKVIFDPFRRATEETAGGAAQGLGLGLYIVEQIVRAHGGSIDVRSEDGEGTTFTVRLPRAGGGQEDRPGG